MKFYPRISRLLCLLFLAVFTLPIIAEARSPSQIEGQIAELRKEERKAEKGIDKFRLSVEEVINMLAAGIRNPARNKG